MTIFFTAQGCLQPADSRRRIPFSDFGSEGTSGLPKGSQAIVTSYQFQCCGNITAWQTYVLTKNVCGGCIVIVHFQVWRPSVSVLADGCYSLVGEVIYRNITSRDGLVNRTLQPDNFLTVEPGDVVGFYTSEREESRGGRIQLDRNYHNESIWFTTNPYRGFDLSGEPCPYQVGRVHSERNGALQYFRSLAPVLSVEISKF